MASRSKRHSPWSSTASPAAKSEQRVPKIGPLGLSPKKIGADIAKDWKGLRSYPRHRQTYGSESSGEGHEPPARSMAKDLTGSVKEILGTCVSVGCTVDGKDLQQEIADGGVEIPQA
nr:60S ribosomal protein L12 [Ipomoea batatas]GMC75270.1 60S ribosomal protein L12 [Ipomoea batatas]